MFNIRAFSELWLDKQKEENKWVTSPIRLIRQSFLYKKSCTESKE